MVTITNITLIIVIVVMLIIAGLSYHDHSIAQHK
jgi:hypothetical protein